MAWLCRAQDATGVGGVAFGYSLYPRRGWSAAYPEITGYIIPTFFNYAAHGGDQGYRRRAIRMAQWEIEVQMPSGAVQGLTLDYPPTPAVFNTGQVLFGWARAFHETGDQEFRDAAIRAAEFLLQAQDPDGAWRRYTSRYVRPGINVYDARTAWGLLEVFRVTGHARYREAAVRNLEFVLTRQHANGWFADCCLRDDNRPLLHTIAYTMEGLLEAGLLLKETRYIEAATRTAEALLVRQRRDGSLAGRFDASWQTAADWSCLTGDAQTAVVWFRLFELTGADRYLEAARRITRYLKATQDLSNRNLGVRGGIKGSYPIWGEYLAYHYPSWAANFFVTSLMLELYCDSNSDANQCQTLLRYRFLKTTLQDSR
jgi:Pectic acid lyase